MRLVTVSTESGPLGGVRRVDGSVASLQRWGCSSVEQLIESGPDAWARVEEESESAGGDWSSDVRLLSPLLRPPRNILCIGLNYVAHHDEGDRSSSIPEVPVVFTKPWTTIIGPHQPLILETSATEKADWEAELAVVIGRGGKNVEEGAAFEHVFGYTLANDVSARDIQLANGPTSQWHKGKSLDSFCPMGPELATTRSIPNVDALQIKLEVNGVLKQDFRVADMYHSIPKLIAYLSRGMALLPGDVILTGTAAGVGVWRDPPEFLRPGDHMRITCEGLGELATPVTAAH